MGIAVGFLGLGQALAPAIFNATTTTQEAPCQNWWDLEDDTLKVVPLFVPH